MANKYPMSVHLGLTRESDPQWVREYQFAKDTITIGRDLDNDLQLLEGLKSGVSRHHAKIKAVDGVHKLIDLSSRNFTFLNNQKLQAEVEYDLKEGDKIKIGEFFIHFSVQVDRIEKEKAPLQALDEKNPFWEETKELALILNRISHKYENVDFLPKDIALEEALRKAFIDLETNQAFEAIRSIFNSDSFVRANSPTQQNIDLQPQAESQPFHSFIDILLDFLVKSNQACKEFRVNFAGETLVKSRRSGSLEGHSCEELKKFLFDPNINLNELTKRLESIQAMTDEIMLHQLALLEGYKAGIGEGMKQILERMNPKKYREQKVKLGKISIPLRLIPILNYLTLVRSWRASYSDIAQEDQSTIEKKYFRPSYVRHYYKRKNISRKKSV
jgi:pSer/pThr/pTyr-binding forkhead associated (FHA) protein